MSFTVVINNPSIVEGLYKCQGELRRRVLNGAAASAGLGASMLDGLVFDQPKGELRIRVHSRAVETPESIKVRQKNLAAGLKIELTPKPSAHYWHKPQ